jgi:cytochrome c556
MQRLTIAVLVTVTAIVAAGIVSASDEHDLPAGPIHDRHELMEEIGKNAKVIGDALKSGNLEPVAGAANVIRGEAAKALALFPAGSTHPGSRAKDEIWTDWAKFESLMKELESTSAALAAAASTGGDTATAAKAMSANCKSCHDLFRKPED